jgi:hypothetical protein
MDASGTEICNDVNKATVVMANLGNGLCRENSFPFVGVWGHSAVAYAFDGKCNSADFNDDTKFLIIEMDGPTDTRTVATMTSSPGLSAYGCYSPYSGLTYVQRLKIIAVARLLVFYASDISYTAFNVLSPDSWDGTIPDIDGLRCGGLVEVCYEINGVDLWGKIPSTGPIHFDIYVDLEEHNEFDAGL